MSREHLIKETLSHLQGLTADEILRVTHEALHYRGQQGDFITYGQTQVLDRPINTTLSVGCV